MDYMLMAEWVGIENRFLCILLCEQRMTVSLHAQINAFLSTRAHIFKKGMHALAMDQPHMLWTNHTCGVCS